MRRSVDQRSLPSELGATTVPEHCQTRKTGPIGSANSKTPFAGAAAVTMENGCVTNGLENGQAPIAGKFHGRQRHQYAQAHRPMLGHLGGLLSFL